MKLKIVFLINLLLILLLSVSGVQATTFNQVVIFSDHRSAGWNLNAYSKLNSTPTHNPTATISASKGSVTMGSIGGDGYWGSFSGPAGSSPNDAEGKNVVWTSDNSDTLTTAIGSNAIEEITLSTNLAITSGGTNFSWQNTEKDLTRFQIRISYKSDPDNWIVDHKYYPGAYDFLLSDADFVGTSDSFSFTPGEDYLVRLEARKHSGLDITAGSLAGDDSWAGIINRSVVFLDYSQPVPEPATMVLFGFGLLGLAGVNRRKK